MALCSSVESSEKPLAGVERAESISDVCRACRLSAQLNSSGSELCSSSLLCWRCRLPSGMVGAGEWGRGLRPLCTEGDGCGVTQAGPEVPAGHANPKNAASLLSQVACRASFYDLLRSAPIDKHGDLYLATENHRHLWICLRRAVAISMQRRFRTQNLKCCLLR